jgi:hypothetical protein
MNIDTTDDHAATIGALEDAQSLLAEHRRDHHHPENAAAQGYPPGSRRPSRDQ